MDTKVKLGNLTDEELETKLQKAQDDVTECKIDLHYAHKTLTKLKQQLYYRENKEKIKDYYQVYYKENKEKCNAKSREDYANNTELRKKQNAIYRKKTRKTLKELANDSTS